MNPVRPWFYTYVLKCEKAGTFYTGSTNDLKKRIEQHNRGQVYYTKNKLTVRLIYFEVNSVRKFTRGFLTERV